MIECGSCGGTGNAVPVRGNRKWTDCARCKGSGSVSEVEQIATPEWTAALLSREGKDR